MRDFKIYQINLENLLDSNKPGTEHWKEFYKILVPHKNLVDRYGSVIMPFQPDLYEQFKFPLIDKNFKKTFEDLMLERANEILKKQEITQKPIYLFYSGGIDSTAIVVAFLKILSINEIKNKITIVLTQESIAEYPKFYYEIIRPNFKIISADNIEELINESNIVVSGSQGDKIFGTDHIGKIFKLGLEKNLFSKLDKKFITQYYIIRGLSENAADTWFNILREQINDINFDIKTNFEYLWWFNINYEWQSEFFLFILRSKLKLTEKFINENMYAFYGTTGFQNWSVHNQDKKILDRWTSYKFPAKNFIYTYTKDKDYHDYKVKLVSAGRLFQGKLMPLGLTESFDILTEIKEDEFYRQNNSFI